MKAIILAAGEGSRISVYNKVHNDGKPKPLTQVAGYPLIYFPLDSLRRAGIRDIYVVIGYKGYLIREELENGSRYGVRIHYIENDEWKRSNGISLLTALKRLYHEDCVAVMMADHIIHPYDVGSTIKRGLRDGEDCVLAVDSRNIDKYDRDATKVIIHRDNMQIINIGKDLKLGNTDVIDNGFKRAIDAGLHILRPQSIPEINGDEFNKIKWIWANSGTLYGHPISNLWVDVDTEKDLIIAERMLYEGGLLRFFSN